ncbi:hypothetical protein ACFWY5_46935 [Nonomuraea sp. NPDC059007]|uniref:NucA/NucB deoxyribonuclease domain-containing protein n=1 Tax=Nonomuraea sp. NPDC059007 TaxID=3346692 RepID=UPI0036B8376F
MTSRQRRLAVGVMLATLCTSLLQALPATAGTPTIDRRPVSPGIVLAAADWDRIRADPSLAASPSKEMVPLLPRRGIAAVARESRLNAARMEANGPRTAAMPLAPPPIRESPDPKALADCFTPAAERSGGHILNRFVFCQRIKAEMPVDVFQNGRVVRLGTTKFTYELITQGDNHQRRTRMFGRIQKGSVRHEGTFAWRVVAPAWPFYLVGRCEQSGVACPVAHAPVVLPFRQWDDETVWWKWDTINQAGNAEGRDRITLHDAWLEFGSAISGGIVTRPGHSAPRIVRCDSADYFRLGGGHYEAACVFAETTPRLTWEIGKAPHAEVALHIANAQDFPNATWPRLVPDGQPPPRDKIIPGKYKPGDPDAPGLHRIRTEQSGTIPPDPEHRRNGERKTGACYGEGPYAAEYFGLGLPVPPRPGEQCDEYPPASTLEGADHPEYDFSVRAVLTDGNSRAGIALRDYYVHDRMLLWDVSLPLERNDRFYFEILTQRPH